MQSDRFHAAMASIACSFNARCRWIVRAFSPRDGGWVRLALDYFYTEESAWIGVILFWDLMVMAGDYTTVDVKRTIRFLDQSCWN